MRVTTVLFLAGSSTLLGCGEEMGGGADGNPAVGEETAVASPVLFGLDTYPGHTRDDNQYVTDIGAVFMTLSAWSGGSGQQAQVKNSLTGRWLRVTGKAYTYCAGSDTPKISDVYWSRLDPGQGQTKQIYGCSSGQWSYTIWKPKLETRGN